MAIKGRNIHYSYVLPGRFASADAYLTDRRLSAAREGDMYYDTTLDVLRTYDGTSWHTAGQTSTSAGSLDDAAQVGAKITNTQGIEIEASAATSNLFILDANGTTNVDVLDISSAGGSGDLINLTQAGTGKDINGTSATWSVTKAGVGAFAGITLADNKPLTIGTGSDITVQWDTSRLQIDGAAADTAIWIGNDKNQDVVIYGDTSTDAITIDTSAESIALDGFDLTIQDDDILKFGDSSDITMTWDQTKFVINAASADSAIHIGAANYNLDLVIFGDTTTDAVTFDTSAEDVQLNGFDLTIQDDDILNFGDSDDVTIYWDQTKLNIIPAADDTVLNLGAAATAFDLTWNSGTSGDYVTFDASAVRAEFVDVDIRLDDSAKLLLGSSADGSATDGNLYWDGSNLQMSAGGANLQINDDVVIGTASTGEENLTVNGDLTVTGDFNLTGGIDFGSLALGDAETLTFGAGSDVVMQWDTCNLRIEAASDNVGQIQIGAVNSMDLAIYGSTNTKIFLFDVSAGIVEINDWDIHLQDDDELQFGDTAGGDISVVWDQTTLAIDGGTQANVIDFGKTTEVDVVFHGASNKDIYWDCTTGQAIVEDDTVLAFGNSSDITMYWDQTDFHIDAVTANRVVNFGKSNNIDLIIFGDTTTDAITFDTSAESMSMNGFDLSILDDDILQFGDSADITITWDQTQLLIDGVAADTAILIGKTNNQDIVIYGDTSTDAITFDTSAESMALNGFDLAILDDDILKFGDAATGDVSITWDKTNLLIEAAADNTGQIRIGSTNAIDTAIYGSTNTNIALWDVSEAILDLNGWDINLQDDDYLRFGDSDDITMVWDQTRFVINAAAADSAIHIGAANYNLDLVIFGDTTTDAVTFDTSEESVSLDGFDLTLNDDDILKFGNSADITITWDQTQLLVDGAAADTQILIGKTNNQDVVIYGDTTTDAITIDTSDEDIDFNGFDLSVNDDDLVKFGDSDDITITWDQTELAVNGAAANNSINIGKTTVCDFTLNGATATADFVWDASDDTGTFLDDAKLAFGDADDITVTWDQTQLLIDGAAADTKILIGKTNNQDIVVYGDTTTDAITIDTSAESIVLDGFDLTMNDDDLIKFGNSGAESTLTSDGTNTDWTISSGALTIGDGGTTNYISIATNGSVSLAGNAQVLCLATQANGLGLRVPVYADGAGDPGTSGVALANMCWNSTDKKIYVFDGTNWLASAALT